MESRDMASIIDFQNHKRRREQARGTPAKSVRCVSCGEPHPIVRLAGGEERCVTAFFDGKRWFCRNRGCRKAWLARD